MNQDKYDEFYEVEQNITEKYGLTTKGINMMYDRKFITAQVNKDGERLYLYRQLKTEETISVYHRDNARYTIYTIDGEYAGYIDAFLSKQDEIEIMYLSMIKNKGDMVISLEEVLKDIFINKSFDGLYVNTQKVPSKIKRAYLAISKDNIASQKVAEKSGFERKVLETGHFKYIMSEDRFMQILKFRNQQRLLSQPYSRKVEKEEQLL